jgi:hypothetical protein
MNTPTSRMLQFALKMSEFLFFSLEKNEVLVEDEINCYKTKELRGSDFPKKERKLVVDFS